MATRRQREPAAPRPAANPGIPQCSTRSGIRIQTPAVAVRSGPRNQTAAAVGNVGNHVNAPVDDRWANRRRLTSSLSARRTNAAAADANIIASAGSCSSGGASASRAVSGENKKGATTRNTRTRAKTPTCSISLMERVAAAEAKAARTASLFQVLNDRYEKLAGDYHRRTMFFTEATQTVSKLHAKVVKKESELQKMWDLNVRLQHVVDQKEAQLQAMSEQCKALALSSN